jgi:hypothetical protein
LSGFSKLTRFDALQVVCEAPFLAKLSSLSSIFSGTASGPLSLAACCKANLEPSELAKGTSVRVQFYRTVDADADAASALGGAAAAGEGAATLLLHKVHELPGTDKEVYDGILLEHGVPKESELSVRSKVRLARCFPDLQRRLQWMRVQVMATTVLAQCQAAYNGLHAGQVQVNEAQPTELMGLCHPEGEGGAGGESPPLDLQTLALKALTALLSERSRHTAALLSSTAAAHHGILSALMRKAKTLVNDCDSPELADGLKFGEALLAFTWMFASSSTGSNALNTAGIMSLILPLLKDSDTRRGRFTTLAVKTLEVLMNYSPEMQQNFRDMDGLNVLVDRAHAEVYALAPAATTSADMETDSKPAAETGSALQGSEARVMEEDGMVQDSTSPGSKGPGSGVVGGAGEEEVAFRPFITNAEHVHHHFERCKLLSALLHLMASAGTPIASSADVRELMQAKKKLPELLCTIFNQSERFGASVFEKAAALLTEVAHQEPSCLQNVISEGVAESVLNAISSKLPISRLTVTIVPTVIGALCLSPQGSQFVDNAKPIGKFLASLASEAVVPLLVGDTPSQLGGQLEELMRHNPPLLNSCITGCINMATSIATTADKLASGHEEVMHDAGSSSATARAKSSSGNASSESTAAPAPAVAPAFAEGRACSEKTPPPAQAYLLSGIELVGRLLDPLMTVSEYSRSFVRNNGLVALMDLINRPEIPRDFITTEAGRFIVLVVGKTAYHCPGPVLGDIIERTQALIQLVLVSQKPPKLELATGESVLRHLEFYVTLLSGIVGYLRDSSTATEWDNDKGKKLIESMAQCYCVLRAASSSPSSSPAPEASSAGGGSAERAAGAGSPNNPIGLAPALDAHVLLDGVDVSGEAAGDVADASTPDLCADVARGIDTLLQGLCASIGNPSRRRHNERNSSAQTHEKALATALVGSFKPLLSLDMISEDDTSTFSRAVNVTLGTLSSCFFGSHAAPLTFGSPHRSNRGGVNMLLLQTLEQTDGVDGVTNLLARLVKAWIKNKSDKQEQGATEQGKVEEQLSSAILRCFAFCKKLLDTQLTVVGRNGQVSPQPGFDAVKFKAGLKNKIFAAFEPVWTEASPVAWSSILSSRILDMCLLLMKPNVSEAAAEAPAAAPQAPANAMPAFTHDPATVASLVEMGFPEARVHAALDVVQSNSVELATEWLFTHAEDEDDESSLAAAIALSMGGSSAAGPVAGAAGAAAPESVTSGADDAKQPSEETSLDAKDVCAKNADFLASKSLEWGLHSLSLGHRVEFAVVDTLLWLCNTSDVQRSKVMTEMLEAINVLMQKPKPDMNGLGCLLRALALLISESIECCRTACEQDAFKIVTKLLYSHFLSAIPPTHADNAGAEQCDRSGKEPATKEAASAGAVAQAKDGEDTTGRARDSSQTSKMEWVCSSLLVLQKVLIHEEQARIAESVLLPQDKDYDSCADAGGAGTSAVASGADQDEAVTGGQEKSQEQAQGEACRYSELLQFCMRLLEFKPEAQLLQAAMGLCARLTRRHDLALIFFQGGGLEKVLSLPETSAFAGQAILTGSLIRHVLEDPMSLQISMQSEIRAYFNKLNVRDNGRPQTVRSFLGNCANMVQRNPEIFANAVRASCRIVKSERGKCIALLDRKEDKGQATGADSNLSDSMVLDHTADKSLISISDTAGARVQQGGCKGKDSKAHSKKSIEVLNHVTSLLLARLLSDPRTPTKGGHGSVAAVSTVSSAPPAADETMQMDPRQSATTDAPSAAAGSATTSSPPAASDLPAISPANLLRFMVDLIKFFPGCGHIVMKYTIAPSGSEGGVKDEANKRGGMQDKDKETFLHFLLRELVPSRVKSGSGTDVQWHQAEVSRRATNVCIALLTRNNEVRKRLMGEIVHILQAPPKARATVHLQVLQSLANMLLTFLTVSVKMSSTNPGGQVAPEAVRLFFDAKVPAALCAAIANIDLHHPQANKVGSALLRPLEILCSNSNFADAKAGQNRCAWGGPAAPGGRVASGSGAAGTAGGEGTTGRHSGGAEGGREEGGGEDEMNADVSLVAPRSGLDDSGASVRESMLMALSMHEDEQGDAANEDEAMQDGGSAHENDDMRASDEGEGSEDEADEDEESGPEMETEGSQQDDDEHDSQMQPGDGGWHEVIEDGDHDDDVAMAHASLSAGIEGIERDLAAAAFMRPDDHDRERDVIHHHHSHVLSRQDLDSILEQLMESGDVQIREEHMDMMNGMDMMADMDGRDQPQHQVLSLLVPGGGGMGNRILQHLLPFSGLAEDMQVIRLPSSRGFRDRADGVEDEFSPSALHEVPAADHPLLARSGEAVAETAHSRLGGLDRISRHMSQEMDGSMVFAHAAGGRAWPPRFFVDQPGMPAEYGRDDPLRTGIVNRWSDDGGSSSFMRTVAQQMEDTLVTMLAAAAPPPPQPAASMSTTSASQGASAAPGDTLPLSVDSLPVRPDSPVYRPFAASPVPVAAEAGTGGSSNDAAGAGAAMDVDSSSVNMPLDAAGAAASAGPEAPAAEITTSSTTPEEAVAAAAAAAPAQAAAQEASTADGGDAMDEDDDEDELQTALRLSLQEGQREAAQDASGSGDASARSAEPVPQAAAQDLNPEAAAGASSANAAGTGDAEGAGSAHDSTQGLAPDAAGPAAATVGGEAASGDIPFADGSIDPAFLAELPADLRAEVMVQQVRQNAVASLAASSSIGIDPEFLAALPPDIQADVIRQHQRQEAANNAAAQAQQGGDAANRSEDMDNASFIASLAPDLREEVLITSNEAFLATLPSHLVAEAHLLRERHMTQDAMASAANLRYAPDVRAHMSRRQQRQVPVDANAGPGGARGGESSKVVLRQVVEQENVHPILRLLFIAQPVVKSLMNKMLLHLTAHSSSLDTTVQFLIAAVLQACGAGDSPPEMYGSSCVSTLSDGSMAVLQAKRALEALVHVATHQPTACRRLLKQGFLPQDIVQRFLTHQAGSDKGKGKQNMEGAWTCTPFALMIWVLATDVFCKSTALQEQVLHVLNCALQPVAKKQESRNAAAGDKDQEEKAEKDADDGRYPRLAIHDLTCLTSTLAVSGHSTKMMERWTSLLKTLCGDAVNLVTCTSHLVTEARAEAELSRASMESLVSQLAADDGTDLASLPQLTVHHKHDVRLLRIVRTLRTLWPAKHQGSESKKEQTEDSSQPLAEVIRLDELWELLGRYLCLLEKNAGKAAKGTGLESKAAALTDGAAGGHAEMVEQEEGANSRSGPASPPQQSMSPALLRVQPLVEAFLVVKAPDHVKEPEGKTSGEGGVGGAAVGVEGLRSPTVLSRSLSKTAADDVGKGVKDFVAFAEQHRKTLNLFIRQDKALLHSLPYSPLVRFPKLLDFDNKKHYLRSELKRRNANQRHPNIRLNVRRESVFEDSFHQILPRKPDELKGRLTIVFQGEEGVDAGGLTREWYLTLSKQMLNPDKALFIQSANGLTYQPNPASTIQPDHLKYFKFAGQLVGKALWDEQVSMFMLSMHSQSEGLLVEGVDVFR